MSPAEAVSMMTRMQYVEVPCQRSVAGAGFAAGLQDYPFSIARPNVWLPSKSYFRCELVVKGAGDPADPATACPTVDELIALAPNALGCAFSNAYVLAAGQSISECVNYLPQADALKARTTSSGAWQRSTGKSAWGIGSSFSERCVAISESDNDAGPVDTSLVGLSGLDDYREEIYKPVGANALEDVTLAVALADSSANGANTVFSVKDVGSLLVINGQKFTIAALDSPTKVFLSPKPTFDIGATTNWYCIRRNILRSSEARNRVQIVWVPALGIFEHEAPLGSGTYSIQLSPNADYATAMIESLNPAAKAGAPGRVGTYSIEIESMRFYCAIGSMSIPDSVSTLHLREYAVQSKVMNGRDQNFSFTVPASTSKVHCFLQSSAAGTKASQPPSLFTVGNGSELNLRNLQLTYDSQTRPMTRWVSGHIYEDPSNPKQNSSMLQQIYWQNLVERGADDSPGGSETYNAFLSKGVLASWSFLRDADSRATELQVAVSYGDPKDGESFDQSSRFFIISEFSKAVELTTQTGSIVSVRTLNV